MSKAWCVASAQGIRLVVQITPNAKRTEVVGETEDALKIKLQAPPVDGKANDMLVRFLSDVLDVSKSAVHIVRGQTSRKKLIEIRTDVLSAQEIMGRLRV